MSLPYKQTGGVGFTLSDSGCHKGLDEESFGSLPCWLLCLAQSVSTSQVSSPVSNSKWTAPKEQPRSLISGLYSRMRTQACIYASTHTHTYTHHAPTHAQTHTHIHHACTHARMHACKHVRMSHCGICLSKKPKAKLSG